MGSLPLNLSLSLNLSRRRWEEDGGGGMSLSKSKRSCRGVVKAMAVPKFKGTQVREQQLTEMIEKKVKEAVEVCGKGEAASEECKVAWDEVEELSQAKADFRLRLEKQDPLEYFCQDNPETDECRIYDH
ncbi:calvin cycle protein CP12-3, chloroplastic [Humulus lupulus]|uniref:calvin cycle protein CP12-3, chloroplastic n=1 Tax=Humulus lupulus TaxID=3486 RepID=UPI002B40E79F|nr:calvin cycle protein CP12-3, chloroplastic [Humulus lupulus]